MNCLGMHPLGIKLQRKAREQLKFRLEVIWRHLKRDRNGVEEGHIRIFKVLVLFKLGSRYLGVWFIILLLRGGILYTHS